MSFQPTPESSLTRAWLEQLMVAAGTFHADESVGAVFDKLQGCVDGCPVLRKPFSIDTLTKQAAALLPKEAPHHANVSSC
jgi:hypothetical protein